MRIRNYSVVRSPCATNIVHHHFNEPRRHENECWGRLPALRKGGYSHDVQVNIGTGIGGTKHYVDTVAEKDGRKFLISLKWQQVSGTAEQKVPFEVISLVQAILDAGDEDSKAYLVLGGEGWKLRDFYTGGGLEKHLEYANRVEIVTLEHFIARANQGRL